MIYRDIAGLDSQLTTFGHRIARVQCKVDDRALDLPRVALGRPEVGFKDRRQGNLLSQGPSQQRRCFENDFIKMQNLNLEMTSSGESEKSIRQLRAQIRCFLCFPHQFLQTWLIEPTFQQLEISGYDR